MHNAHKRFGKLVVKYEVDFPKRLNEAQMQQVKKLFTGTFT